LKRGAAVVGVDRDDRVPSAFSGPSWLGLAADVTDVSAVREALRTGVERFGGIDIAVIAAGVFGATRPVAELDVDEWRSVMAVNVDSVAALLSDLHPLLARAPGGGRVVVIASRNVTAPGPGAAAYSASKAALTQLARVCALEWAPDRIRVNTVHPDAVFDTGLWTDEVLTDRAAKYGMTVDEYKRRNLLGAEITSASVGRLVAEMCGDTFANTTGAQIPIDGGNERVI
jgi:NAD(P)-dependent dehydrogenase (short-subunit alcohol dehydrogenase family)